MMMLRMTLAVGTIGLVTLARLSLICVFGIRV